MLLSNKLGSVRMTLTILARLRQVEMNGRSVVTFCCEGTKTYFWYQTTIFIRSKCLCGNTCISSVRGFLKVDDMYVTFMPSNTWTHTPPLWLYSLTNVHRISHLSRYGIVLRVLRLKLLLSLVPLSLATFSRLFSILKISLCVTN
jgi:hypothetical protein